MHALLQLEKPRLNQNFQQCPNDLTIVCNFGSLLNPQLEIKVVRSAVKDSLIRLKCLVVLMMIVMIW